MPRRTGGILGRLTTTRDRDQEKVAHFNDDTAAFDRRDKEENLRRAGTTYQGRGNERQAFLRKLGFDRK